MATVIFSNSGDTDCAVLRYIWKGIPNVKLVEITKDTRSAKELVNQAIEEEHDTLICCGHGSSSGLFDPAGSGYTFLINRQNYKKIKVNRFIGIWCYASDFGKAVHLKGFYSSMFISNKKEAELNHCYNATEKQINYAAMVFYNGLNELIRHYVPMKKWINILNEGGMAGDMPVLPADKSIDSVEFNYKGLQYLTKFSGEPVSEYNYGYGYGYGYNRTDDDEVYDYWRRTYGGQTVKKYDTATSNVLALPKPKKTYKKAKV